MYKILSVLKKVLLAALQDIVEAHIRAAEYPHAKVT